MKRKLKSAYIFVTSLVIALLHLPFAFAKSADTHKLLDVPTAALVPPPPPPMPAPAPLPAPLPVVASVYDSLHLEDAGLSREVYEYAKKGHDKLEKEGILINKEVISIADFSQSSIQKRFYIIDLKNYKILFNTFVAHGKNTGRELASFFSNQPSSYKSSPGFYVTQQTYNGNNGYSLKLQGLEKGINDNAYNRAIVLHGADYVSASFANAHGYLGRSEGCPAVPETLSRPIINTIKDGSCLFIYHPSYINRSSLLK